MAHFDYELLAALEVARQVHDARKPLYLGHILFRWDAECGVRITDQYAQRYLIEQCLGPFQHIGALRIDRKGGGEVFVPRRRDQTCPYHQKLCLPTREDTHHRELACAKYAAMSPRDTAPTFLVDLLDPWPRDITAPRTKRTKGATLSAALRYFVLQRDGFRCQCCGASPQDGAGTTLQVDHQVAKAHGGTDDPANLLTLCDLCNSGKGILDA